MENGQAPAKRVIFSGIQPSGNLTLGNYIGALRNWVALQDEYDCYYCIVNEHAITVRQDPTELRRRTLELMAIYLASGIDPDKCSIFVQSHVPAHAELAWILNCFTYMGELSRMTQYKDKSAKQGENIPVGLFDYPVLMAADILLYQADLVPIGADQKQHLELSRDIAIRFNNTMGETFTVPEPYIGKVGARVMSLQEPQSKMSKSGEPNSYIALMDKPDDIRRKIRRAVTDLDGVVRFDPENKPGVSNLMAIYAALTDRDYAAIEQELAGQGYGALKACVTDAVIAALEPLQNEVGRLLREKQYLEQVMKRSAERAEARARRTLAKVHKRIGFVPPVR
jgi:tryptophanyl-tRNA synthetase